MSSPRILILSTTFRDVMKVIVAVISDLYTDQRVLKQVSLLKSMNCDVTVVCRKLGETPGEIPDPGVRVTFVRPLFSKGFFMYLGFNLRIFSFMLFNKADLYVANDLDTLLPCFLISKLHHGQIVYDAHEYFTGQHGLKERKIKHYMWKWIERRLVPRLKWMITVNNSIAGFYRNDYGVDPLVVRNVAPLTTGILPAVRKERGISETDLAVVVHGMFPRPGRGVEEVIDALVFTHGIFLVIIGAGVYIESIKQKVRTLALENRVSFFPRIPWDEMTGIIKCCDAGLSLDKDTCVNQRYSLPNKLFDYIAAGIPVIASSLPEVKSCIDEFGCGILIDKVEPDTVAEALVKLRDEHQLLASLKENARKASEALNWENESLIEQNLFSRVLEVSKISGKRCQ